MRHPFKYLLEAEENKPKIDAKDPDYSAPAMSAKGYATASGQLPQAQSSTRRDTNFVPNTQQQQQQQQQQETQPTETQTTPQENRPQLTAEPGTVFEIHGVYYEVQEDGDTLHIVPNPNKGSSFWGTLGKGLGATAIAGATVTAGAHALNWNLARRRTNSLKRRYQYEIFGCNEIEDPKRREACLKYNEDKANEELNQFIRLCDGTENPQACKDEILDMMEELL